MAGAFGIAAHDNKAIGESRDLMMEISRSSRNSEKLTKVLIAFTIAVVATGLPIATTTLMNLLTPLSTTASHPYLFAGIFVSIGALIFVGIFIMYPREIGDVILKRGESIQETKVAAGNAGISAQASVKAYNPPSLTFEDYKAAVALLFISVLFLWLSYKIQAIFPPAASNVIGSLIWSMWALLGVSIVVNLIIVYRTFKR